VGWDWVHLVRRPLFGLLYQSWMINDDECEAVCGISIGRGGRSTREKIWPSATLSTMNLTWPDLGSNPGSRNGNPATNRLSYDAASLSNFLTEIPAHKLCQNVMWGNISVVEYRILHFCCTFIAEFLSIKTISKPTTQINAVLHAVVFGVWWVTSEPT
jgi:hypothetical protein